MTGANVPNGLESGDGAFVAAFLDLASPDGAVFYSALRFEVDAGGHLARATEARPPTQEPAAAPHRLVLIPGFCNPHTHLELTPLAGRIEPTPRFTDWAPHLFAWKQEVGPDGLAAGVAIGLRQSLEAGVTAVADTVTTPESVRVLAAAPMPAVAYCEALAVAESQAETGLERFAATFRAAEEAAAARPDFVAGISPHAPHTVTPGLARHLRERFGHVRHLSIHVAETRAELEFLSARTGDFADFFGGLGLLDPASDAMRGLNPVDWIDRNGWLPAPGAAANSPRPLGLLARLGGEAPPLAPRTILAHGNYLSPEDAAFLRRRHAAVCWCPETHAYFSHEPYPVAQNRGLALLLGTDSLASAWSLGPLEQVRRALRSSEKWGEPLPAVEALYGATLGARDAAFGRAAGAPRADFTGLSVRSDLLPSVPEGAAKVAVSNDSLRQLLLDSSTRAAATIIGGRVAWRSASPAAVDFAGAPAGDSAHFPR